MGWLLDAPVEEVFAVFEDIARWPEWVSVRDQVLAWNEKKLGAKASHKSSTAPAH